MGLDIIAAVGFAAVRWVIWRMQATANTTHVAVHPKWLSITPCSGMWSLAREPPIVTLDRVGTSVSPGCISDLCCKCV
jgi:hypothetical protein